MSDLAVNHFEVDVEPGELSGSFWHKLASMRLNIAGNLVAQAVAAESGGATPSVLPGSRIVIRETSSGKEVWHINSSDVTGGTSPDQLRDDIETDLKALSLQDFATNFATKWDIAK